MPAMDKFELIEHTADIGLKACGERLDEAFANAALGMFSIIVETASIIEVESRRVVVTADDAEGLLFEWLNRLIFLFDVEGMLLKKFDIREFDENRLQAVCYGEKYDPLRHQVKMGVKSATYHMLKVDREKNQVQVILDV